MGEIIMNEKIKIITLNDRIEEFISWYNKEMLKSLQYGKYSYSKELKNFIDKMAVWYELRYPDYEIDRKLDGYDTPSKKSPLNYKNEYIRNKLEGKLLKGDSNGYKEAYNGMEFLESLAWPKLYNLNAFIRALPKSEKGFLAKVKYPESLSINLNSSIKDFKLTSNGEVREKNDSSNIVLEDKYGQKLSFNSINLEKLLEVLQCDNFIISDYDIDKITRIINRYKLEQKCYNGILDSVMYKIIERGSDYYAGIRAYMFASEFARDRSVPMIYGMDTNNPYLKKIINDYLESGGNKDLVCYDGYITRSSDRAFLNEYSLDELLEKASLNNKKASKRKVRNIKHD